MAQQSASTSHQAHSSFPQLPAPLVKFCSGLELAKKPAINIGQNLLIPSPSWASPKPRAPLHNFYRNRSRFIYWLWTCLIHEPLQQFIIFVSTRTVIIWRVIGKVSSCHYLLTIGVISDMPMKPLMKSIQFPLFRDYPYCDTKDCKNDNPPNRQPCNHGQKINPIPKHFPPPLLPI